MIVTSKWPLEIGTKTMTTMRTMITMVEAVETETGIATEIGVIAIAIAVVMMMLKI